MFEFATPWAFVLMGVLPLLWWGMRRREVPALRVSATAPFSLVERSWAVSGAKLVPLCAVLALVLMIVALARPRMGVEHSLVKTAGVNIVIALDTSGSMAALDFTHEGKTVDRLVAVKQVVDRFVAGRSGDRIGLVVFGTEAFTQIPLTRDYNTISSILEEVEIGAAGEQTAIGDALGISLKRLEDIESTSNVIVLLTDGENTAGELAPLLSAELAAKRGVKVYTIGVGTKGKVPFLVDHPLFGKRYVYQEVSMDEGTLKKIAAKTGGLYFRAEDAEALEKIWATIDRMEKSEVEVTSWTEYSEYYRIPLLMALVFLLTSVTLGNTRFLRVP
ncbi:vWA domain-containing protein [Desulfoluna spongiiphila]|uniref:Ca-activated chloride channel family protein n=1 Tax=Desulfoluna spongiiphila TaxID=419481 RepID=A0A1G5IIX5_9BACT|nr:VWA domain-containing protein [Desulfoluna spongiiphila]SCY76085.1 Ca-activated chloride channel family protein [Desulfoluna spongiiphila]VVS90929.1 von willebrand factor type a [Desulfoluna spongiiphila]